MGDCRVSVRMIKTNTKGEKKKMKFVTRHETIVYLIAVYHSTDEIQVESMKENYRYFFVLPLSCKLELL